MAKFKIILEVEIEETKEITRQVIEDSHRNYQDFMADPEQVAYLGYEQQLLDLLLTNPEAYKKFMTANALSRLEGMSWQEVRPLAGIDRQDFETLADVVPELPPAAKAHFEETLRDEWFWNATDLITQCFLKYRFTSVKVEGDFTPPGAIEHD